MLTSNLLSKFWNSNILTWKPSARAPPSRRSHPDVINQQKLSRFYISRPRIIHFKSSFYQARSIHPSLHPPRSVHPVHPPTQVGLFSHPSKFVRSTIHQTQLADPSIDPHHLAGSGHPSTQVDSFNHSSRSVNLSVRPSIIQPHGRTIQPALSHLLQAFLEPSVSWRSRLPWQRRRRFGLRPARDPQLLVHPLGSWCSVPCAADEPKRDIQSGV